MCRSLVLTLPLTYEQTTMLGDIGSAARAARSRPLNAPGTCIPDADVMPPNMYDYLCNRQTIK